MMNVKRFILVVAVVGLLAGLSLGTSAQCAVGEIIANVNGWQNMGAAGGLGTTVLAKFWALGNIATMNSGTVAQANLAKAYSTGYYASSNWMNVGVVGCPCPGGVCGTSRTVFLYSRANAGVAQFLVMQAPYTSRFDFDLISNGPGNTPSVIAVPAVTVLYAVKAAGVYTAYVTWPQFTAAQLKGYYDVLPANNIITGVAISYAEGAAAPATFATGSWTKCTTGFNCSWGTAGLDYGTGVSAATACNVAGSVITPTVAPGWTVNQWTVGGGARYVIMNNTAYPIVSNTATSVTVTGTPTAGAGTYRLGWRVTFPQAVTAGNRSFLSLSVLFDSQVPSVAGRGEALSWGETSFVGAPSLGIQGPTAAPLFVSNDISAHQGMVTVNWNTNVEATVASFDVYYSAQKNGSYVLVTNTTTQPKGNDSFYSVTFEKPVKGQKLFYKVAANMADGSTEWSDILKIVK